jgi:P-type Na+/K+ transporter
MLVIIIIQIDEALLAGESLPVQKYPEEVFDDDIGPADRLKADYHSSTITRGRARWVFFATGISIEIDPIASVLQYSNTSERWPIRCRSD